MTNVKRLDTSKSNEKADAALMELYRRLRERNTPEPGSFTSLDTEERREYFRLKRRESRAKHRAAVAAGSLPPTQGNVRAALADAALMLLATDGPGADQIRAVLANAFSARPGVPLTIEQRARAGKLRPKLVGVKQ